ncbi:UDP-2,3-diacylglucosamine diphosphatase [Thermosipho atlanticus]|uniref:Calcineurin-like phosphoesterase n=1 Tax=Thermosipho atlanticus DSM 15807 TaxID=1123380 RepID=A0A1M5R1V7_9BACT|nr:UDP-2,3-diacylglucosamine diphosphatase [Thermosipho atlanticus]SHH19979.1 Calcineurin-like phosphoesterase [Thermosipho atlanticus DSM 15807]
MKRYLFISDLHIGDGSAKDDFEFDKVFEKTLEDFSSLSEVELFIVGDGFELLETSKVSKFGLIEFEELINKLEPDIIIDIEKKHRKVFDALRNFAKNNKIHYIVGNHDYYLLKNLKLQEKLKELIPNLEVEPYFYDEHVKLLVIHGNQFDPVNKFAINKKNGEIVPPLGDFIVRYMMSNFDKKIENFVPQYVIKEYDNVRPTLDLFNWFEVIMETYDLSIDLFEMWITEFLKMMRSLEAKEWMKNNYPFLSIFSKVFLNRFGGIKFGELLVRLIMNIRKVKKTDYLLKKAKKILSGKMQLEEYLVGYEDGKEIGDVNGVIMGHIHHNNFKIIDVDNKPKYYINCGSWKPIVEKLKKNFFHKKNELFYALLTLDKDVEITTATINQLKRREVVT